MKPQERNAKDYLQDILDAIENIEQFTEGFDYDRFTADRKTVFAVIRALEIIGEATKKIPDSLRNQHSKVPWGEMAGMRDKLIHDYFVVNMEVVWKTVQRDLPTLKPLINQILQDQP